MATENIVALCDVDWVRAAGTFKTFPRPSSSATTAVCSTSRKDIDAVMIATPDHMHAPITLAALRRASTFTSRSRWPTASRKPA